MGGGAGVDGDVGAGVAPGDPLRELSATDRLRFEQRTVPVVDVPQHTVRNVRAEFLVIRVGELVVDDLREYSVLVREPGQLVEFSQ